MADRAESFLGTGWGFPVVLDDGGEVQLVDRAEDVRQAIRLILDTTRTERELLPEFGSGLHSLVFEPINRTTMALVEHQVRQALVAWEPRIDRVEVEVDTGDRRLGRLEIHVRYRLRSTNTFYNLVYPFYLQEGSR